MRSFILLSSVLLAGCTTTAAKLEDRAAVQTIDSSKSPQQLASCIADHMTGASVRGDGADHLWVVRENDFGAIGRWDVYRTPAGSRAEWRRASGLTTGAGAGRACV